MELIFNNQGFSVVMAVLGLIALTVVCYTLFELYKAKLDADLVKSGYEQVAVTSSSVPNTDFKFVWRKQKSFKSKNEKFVDEDQS